MKRAIYIITLILALNILGGIYAWGYGNVYAQDDEKVVDCFIERKDAEDPEEWDRQCVPKKGIEFQGLVVNLVYYVWVLGGTAFVLVGMYIGYEYMTSGSDSQKKATLQKRGTYYVISIILLFASHPIAAFMMKLFVTSSSDCYAEIKNTPGFTFFFEDVCSGNYDTATLCSIDNESECEFDRGGSWCSLTSQCFPRDAASSNFVYCVNNHYAGQVFNIQARIDHICSGGELPGDEEVCALPMGECSNNGGFVMHTRCVPLSYVDYITAVINDSDAIDERIAEVCGDIVAPTTPRPSLEPRPVDTDCNTDPPVGVTNTLDMERACWAGCSGKTTGYHSDIPYPYQITIDPRSPALDIPDGALNLTCYCQEGDMVQSSWCSTYEDNRSASADDFPELCCDRLAAAGSDEGCYGSFSATGESGTVYNFGASLCNEADGACLSGKTCSIHRSTGGVPDFNDLVGESCTSFGAIIRVDRAGVDYKLRCSDPCRPVGSCLGWMNIGEL